MRSHEVIILEMIDELETVLVQLEEQRHWAWDHKMWALEEAYRDAILATRRKKDTLELVIVKEADNYL